MTSHNGMQTEKAQLRSCGCNHIRLCLKAIRLHFCFCFVGEMFLRSVTVLRLFCHYSLLFLISL